jgi:hypothetical protein
LSACLSQWTSIYRSSHAFCKLRLRREALIHKKTVGINTVSIQLTVVEDPAHTAYSWNWIFALQVSIFFCSNHRGRVLREPCGHI